MKRMMRYPWLGRRRLTRALGPGLGAKVTWTATDEPIPDSDLARVFNDTDDIHKPAHYPPIYESVLAPFRQHPIRMLEIGVFRGGSLQMWKQYLHPDSTIVGIDINPDCAKFDDPPRNIHVRIGSQDDTKFLQTVVDEFGPFDIIIDDGSHLSSHMIGTFKYLFPNGLADSGVYVVEDLYTNYWMPYRDTPTTFAQFATQLVTAMHAHYPAADSYDGLDSYLRVGDPKRKNSFQVPVAATLLEKIEFHDSIVAIHRARKGGRELPRILYNTID